MDFLFKFTWPGMTNANMQLVVISVDLDDKMETPAPRLEAGEFIVSKVVELAKLKTELESKAFLSTNSPIYTHLWFPSDYDRKVRMNIFSLHTSNLFTF